MAKKKLQLKDKSINGAGFKKDYKDSIIEYILNSFEANANNVYIFAEPYSEEMNKLDKLKIVDDGDGINFESIDDTFGTFLVSQKEKNVFFDRFNKGKGRYAFYNFATSAKWTTVCKKEDSNYKYEITIRDSEKDYWENTDPIKSNEVTGTSVEFFGIKDLKLEDITGEDLEYKIIGFFAKFLYLYKGKNIFINGKKLSYSILIDENMSESFDKTINGVNFNCCFIKWIDGSNQKSYAYYVNQNYIEKYREHTKCNNNTVKFYHSLFISSSYFDNFAFTNSNDPLFPPFVNQSDKTFKQLQIFVFAYVKNMLKKFIKEEVPGIIQSYIKDGLFPEFTDDPYSQAQKEDLTSVIEEVYCIQPAIFYRSKKEHKKAIIGCLNLILKTNERENIITILDSIQKLTTEERSQLADTLRRYEPQSVIRLLNTIKARCEIINKLKELVYDNTKFTNERNHIQQIIENDYWLFGEEYNLVSADERLETVLMKYMNYLDKTNITGISYNDPRYKDRRPDIFISGTHNLPSNDNESLQENIVIELKAPSVKLSIDVYRQIEDYMNAIIENPEFNSVYKKWKFICVCNTIEPEVKAKYKSFESYNKRGLVNKVDNYEVYAYTWSDVFTMFDLRHRHLYKKLEKDKNFVETNNHSFVGRELSDRLTEEIKNLSDQAK